MKNYQISQLGAIFFFLGLTLLLISWSNSYPILIGELDELTFSQFSVLIWPGIFLSSIGLFITGYSSARKSIKAICAALFPLCIYAHVFYFRGTMTSDIGNVKSMAEVFQLTGIDSTVIPYFQYPSYFVLNDATAKITGLAIDNIAMIFFALFGILLGLYLYLFLFQVTKINGYQIAFLGGFIYFSISFSFLNYQWVPQTLALVFFFLILVTFKLDNIKYKALTLLFFIALLFTHAFIPVLFLLFFGLYSIKKRDKLKLFVLMICLYLTVFIYFTTYYFPQIMSVFMETFYGFGEYSSQIAESFKETGSIFDQLISQINRIRVLLTVLIISIGFFIGFIKKNINYKVIILGIVGGIYLGLGLLYQLLGLRALQILIMALVVGIGYFITKMKKPTVALILVLIILSIFGPIRGSYDQTQFLTSEEENTCGFLASSLSYEKKSYLALDQVDWGYFTHIERYINKGLTIKARSSSILFYQIFNTSMKNNNYVIYNSNLGKEIKYQGKLSNYREYIFTSILLNNKIYSCGKTSIVAG